MASLLNDIQNAISKKIPTNVNNGISSNLPAINDSLLNLNTHNFEDKLKQTTYPTYSVTYHPNYIGSTSKIKYHNGTIKLEDGSIFKAPSGKKLVSWCELSDGKSTRYALSSEQKFDKDIDLYAIWGNGYQTNVESGGVTDYYDVIAETTHKDEKSFDLLNSDNLVKIKYSGDAYDNISQDIVDEIEYKYTNNGFISNDNEITPMFNWYNNDDYVATGIRTKTFQVIESLEYLDDMIADFTKTIPLYKVDEIDGEKIPIMVGVYETTIHDISMNTYMNDDGRCITTVLLVYSKNKYYLTDKKIISNSQIQNESNKNNDTNKYDYTSSGIYDILSYSYDKETHKYTCRIINPSDTSKKLKGNGKKLSNLYLAVTVKDKVDTNLHRNRKNKGKGQRKVYMKYRNGKNSWYVPYTNGIMLGSRVDDYDNIVFDESLIQIPKSIKYDLKSTNKTSTAVEYYFVLKDKVTGRVHKSYKSLGIFNINKTVE